MNAVDSSTYGCTICGKKFVLSHHIYWDYRCLDCDPDLDWFWLHYEAQYGTENLGGQ